MRRPIVLLIALLLTGPVAAQPGPGSPPAPYNELMYLGDEQLHRELKLTADQVKKLTAFRDRWFADFVAARRDEDKLGQMMRSGEKFLADTLDDAQRKRLGQVILQQGAASGGPFTRLPAEVIKELKLTKAQQEAVEEVHETWREAVTGYRTWKEEDRSEKIVKAMDAMDVGVGKLLNKEQAKRFEQILLQNVSLSRGRGLFGGPAPAPPAVLRNPGLPFEEQGLQAVLLYPPAVKELGLTDAQKQQVVELVGDARRVRNLMGDELLAQEEPGEVWAKTNAAYGNLVNAKLQNLLSPKQQEQLTDLLGEPFKGTLIPDRVGFFGGFGGGGFGGPF